MRKLTFLIAVVILVVLGYNEWETKLDKQEARDVRSKLEAAGMLVKQVSASSVTTGVGEAEIKQLDVFIQELQSKKPRLPKLQEIAVKTLKSAQGQIRARQKAQWLKDLPLGEIADAFKTVSDEAKAANEEAIAAVKAFCVYVEQPEKSLKFLDKDAILQKCSAL